MKTLRPRHNGGCFLALDSGHELKLSRGYCDSLSLINGRMIAAV